MRKIFLLLFVLVLTGIVANARTINALPESGFIDGEVSTNVCINLSNTSNKTQFKIDVEFSSNVSNEVQVLIGKDIDENGNLDTDEAQICFGWSVGKWYLCHMDNPSNILYSQKVNKNNKKGSFALFLSETKEPLKIQTIIDGYVTSTSLDNIEQCLFNPNWNMAKIIHRGCGISDSSFAVRLEAETLLILLK